MSRSPSPPAFVQSSPSTSIKPSRYTFRHLHLLRQNSPSSPLRVIAHIDLDAFYAQCEMLRLGTPRDTPLAVQQWDSLIAINYAARPFGITRMLSAIEAKKRCPELVLQHVATFREGEGGKWAYRDDASCKIKTDKVSLDPYRAQSRRILSTIKEEVSRQRDEIINSKGVPLEFQAAKIEKASVDEVFLDLSSLVYAVLYQRYPELRRTPTTSDKTTPLPSPPTTALEWFPEDGLVDLDEEETEEDDPDWDDVAMLTGAEITRSIRAAIWDKLSYTCSAGIARNKMMSKLGSAQNKPNKQTVIRNRAIQKFLGGFQFTKIRWLGGKLGERISAEFGTEQVKELLNVSLEQFKAKLDDDTAVWVYNIIRGIDDSEVNPRTQIKSMLSAKSFRPSINSADQARKWLRIFAADLYNRLVEDGLLENKRRPTTLSLHHRMGGQVHSKSTPIPGGKMVTEDILYDLSSNLLNQVIAEARAWPCANLSVNVTGFEEGPVNNRAIDSFFTPGQSKPLAEPSLPKKVAEPLDDEERPTKVRKVAAKGIGSFFKRDSPSLVNSDNDKDIDDRSPPLFSTADIPTTKSPQDNDITIPETHEETSNQLYDGTFTCPRCNEQVPEDQREEHDDWHFAKDLDAQEVRADQTSRNIAEQSSRRTASDHKKTGPGRPRAAAPKTEKGQKRLFFG
ncbi:N-acetyltransferase eso1 [Talaromyces pinophilus]|nr:N-acetyltransferase eso1 [Talaromyces pinophilus]